MLQNKLSLIITALLYLIINSTFGQNPTPSDSVFIHKLYEYGMSNGKAYNYLDTLCNQIGPRLSGSTNAQEAVSFTAKVLQDLNLDTSFQSVIVPHWERGATEVAFWRNKQDSGELSICALGGSISTPIAGIQGNIIEVQNFTDLKKLGHDQIKGKIVFYNRPMNPAQIYTFAAYSGSVDQRWAGAMRAAEYGATGVIVRSMTLALDDHPHTGSMGYSDTIPKIPAVAVSTKDAELLHQLLAEHQNQLEIGFKLYCETLPDTQSYNVLGTWQGKESTKVIAIGGHLDSWDTGDGAHDDGAGCVQSIEALRLLKQLNYIPKHTLRAVMFMNEENGLRGGKTYARIASAAREDHVAAIESDRGGFSPRGFHFEATTEQMKYIGKWASLFDQVGLHVLKKGGSGADIGPLRENGYQKLILAGLVPDSQRYFDFHHAETDVLSAVNERELQSGAIAMAVLIYMLDQHLEDFPTNE